MFEQLMCFVRERDYFGAGLILSSIGNMTRAPSKREPQGFYDAQVRVIPMEDCLHIFMLIGDQGEFWKLPGDQVSATDGSGARLLSKRVILSDLYSPDCDKPVQLHFLYAYEDAPGVIEA